MSRRDFWIFSIIFCILSFLSSISQAGICDRLLISKPARNLWSVLQRKASKGKSRSAPRFTKAWADGRIVIVDQQTGVRIALLDDGYLHLSEESFFGGPHTYAPKLPEHFNLAWLESQVYPELFQTLDQDALRWIREAFRNGNAGQALYSENLEGGYQIETTDIALRFTIHSGLLTVQGFIRAGGQTLEGTVPLTKLFPLGMKPDERFLPRLTSMLTLKPRLASTEPVRPSMALSITRAHHNGFDPYTGQPIDYAGFRGNVILNGGFDHNGEVAEVIVGDQTSTDVAKNIDRKIRVRTLNGDEFQISVTNAIPVLDRLVQDKIDPVTLAPLVGGVLPARYTQRFTIITEPGDEIFLQNPDSTRAEVKLFMPLDLLGRVTNDPDQAVDSHRELIVGDGTLAMQILDLIKQGKFVRKLQDWKIANVQLRLKLPADNAFQDNIVTLKLTPQKDHSLSVETQRFHQSRPERSSLVNVGNEEQPVYDLDSTLWQTMSPWALQKVAQLGRGFTEEEFQFTIRTGQEERVARDILQQRGFRIALDKPDALYFATDEATTHPLDLAQDLIAGIVQLKTKKLVVALQRRAHDRFTPANDHYGVKVFSAYHYLVARDRGEAADKSMFDHPNDNVTVVYRDSELSPTSVAILEWLKNQ